MKRFLTILLTTLALAGLLCVSASASSFDGPAAEPGEIDEMNHADEQYRPASPAVPDHSRQARQPLKQQPRKGQQLI